MSEPEPFDSALDVLRSEGMRITEPRKALLQFLVERERPVSAEEVHESLGQASSDLVTVYRNLEAFEKAGIVQRVMTESGKALFEIIGENHHHHHILCRKCHRAEKLDVCEVERLEQLACDLGYSEVKHVLELYGVCSDCRDE